MASTIATIEQDTLALPRVAADHLVWQLYDEIFNEGELALAPTIIAAHAVTHLCHADPDLPLIGPEHVQDFVPLFCAVFPDAYWLIDDIVSSSETVAVRTTVTGTHLGDYRGIPPSGQSFVVTGIELLKLDHGKIVERWSDVSPLAVIQHMVATRYLERLPAKHRPLRRGHPTRHDGSA